MALLLLGVLWFAGSPSGETSVIPNLLNLLMGFSSLAAALMPQPKLYILSRAFAAFFGFTNLLGVLWFAGAPEGDAFVVPGTLMGFSSLGAALVPRHKLSRGAVRRTLFTLYVVAIGAGFVLVVNDLGASRGIEWHVVAIRLLHIAALATTAIMALNPTTRPPTS